MADSFFTNDVFEGARDTSGLVINPLNDKKGWDGDGDNGFRIAWTITKLDALEGPNTFNAPAFQYEYWITGSVSDNNGGFLDLSKGLSHWDLQVTRATGVNN